MIPLHLDLSVLRLVLAGVRSKFFRHVMFRLVYLVYKLIDGVYETIGRASDERILRYYHTHFAA